MFQRIFFLSTFFLPLILKGQALSNEGRFSIEFDKGCNPMTVNITELDTFAPDVTRQYTYEENITNNKFYTYRAANTYKIIQLLSGTLSDTLEVEVFDSFEPKIDIEKCSGNEISVTSEESIYDYIRVYFGGADSVDLDFNTSTTFSFGSNFQQSITIKGFFEDADNKCSNYYEQVLPIPFLPSPTITSVAIKESCKDIFTMYLNLDSFDSLITYQVELSQSSTNILFEGKLTSNQLTFSDIPFSKTEADYCVQVNAVDPCNSSRVDGNEICQQSSNLSLSPFESLSSSYDGNGILINLDEVASGSFNVFRRQENGNFQKEDSVTSSYRDAIGTNSRKYFYKIDYIDSCDQVLFSANTNPPFIDPNKIAKNSYSVEYTFPTPLANGTYILESIVGNNENSTIENFRVIKSNDVQDPFSFDLNLDAKDGTSVQIITTKLYSLSGEFLRQSNSINVKFDIEIYVPTAFTPNDDGLNDTLDFFGLPSNKATIKIYSKWGHLIYSSDDPTLGWDGTINGKHAPEGTYLYEIIFESSKGEKLRQKGTFALITK